MLFTSPDSGFNVILAGVCPVSSGSKYNLPLEFQKLSSSLLYLCGVRGPSSDVCPFNASLQNRCGFVIAGLASVRELVQLKDADSHLNSPPSLLYSTSFLFVTCVSSLFTFLRCAKGLTFSASAGRMGS